MKRALPLILVALLLPGCGLHPLYASGDSGSVAAVLRQVQVSTIPGRAGWLMYNKLKQRLGEMGDSAPAYRLDVKLDENIIGLGIRGDRATTRERETLRARYQLVNLATGQVVLDATAGSDEGIDVVSSEYATVAAEQTAQERLADLVADDIVSRLGVYATHTPARQ
jgi:LPS-assembly lipoprotein